MPKVVHGFSWKFVCTMGMGPRTNLYNLTDPIKQKNYLFKRNADSAKMNGKYFVGDPLTHLCNKSNIAA